MPATSRTERRSRLRTGVRVLTLVLATLAPTLATPAAVAGEASVALEASAPRVTFGEIVTLSGSATGDAACEAGRTVELQWRPADAPGFSTVATSVTAGNGSFSIDHSPSNTGRFRALLPAAGTCSEAASPGVLVRVRVAVAAAASPASIEVGGCVSVSATVSPPKPGQTVDLQRRTGGVWASLESLPLDAAGEADARPCFGSDDAGVVRLRLRWEAQDALNETGTSPTLTIRVTDATWMVEIEDAIGSRSVSVSVAEDGEELFHHADEASRTPASNEKLLLAMASLDRFGPDHRIVTHAAARSVGPDGIVDGDLWILGRGDPLTGRAALGALADELVEAGVVRVRGGVRGSTTFFERDWDAPGWNDVARDYVNRPTALTFEGNGDLNPERAAAQALIGQLERRGIRVVGGAGAGVPPGGLEDLATIESKPLRILLARMLRPSWNFAAEVLGKGLGAEVQGPPGTIAKGANAIEAWIQARGVDFTLFDNSGLSYDNRVTAAGIVELLTQAEAEDWGDELRDALPTGGQGTLEHRLAGVRVRAKTGTLTDVSALSGWVWARELGAWIEFSILCEGMSKSVASGIEDRIVRILRSEAG